MSKKKDILNEKSLRRVALTFVYWVKDEADYNLLATFLGSLKVPCLVSPLHDHDINETNCDDGTVEMKPPHYHVIIDMQGNPKTINQWFALLSPIRDYISIAPFDRYDFSEITNLEELRSKSCLINLGLDPILHSVLKVWEEENSIKNMRGLIRYFKHIDNPEKHQYLDQEYSTFGGFDVTGVLLSKTDQISISLKIQEYIREHNCFNYADLIDYCAYSNIEWYQVLMGSSTISNNIIKYQKSALFRHTGAQAYQIIEYKSRGEKIKDNIDID